MARIGINALRVYVNHICRILNRYGTTLTNALPTGAVPAILALQAVCGLFKTIGIIDVE